MTELETNSVSFERIKEYSEIETEAPWQLADHETATDWPRDGVVEFTDYKTRYRNGLDFVLNGISFHTNTREKIGICGRTG